MLTKRASQKGSALFPRQELLQIANDLALAISDFESFLDVLRQVGQGVCIVFVRRFVWVLPTFFFSALLFWNRQTYAYTKYAIYVFEVLLRVNGLGSTARRETHRDGEFGGRCIHIYYIFSSEASC